MHTELSFVVRFMEEFYEKLIEVKKKVKKRQWEKEQDIQTETILDDLEKVLKTQALDAPRYGGEFAVSCYQEVQFVMAALADEVFLSFKWSGRAYWADHLLESKLFGTHNAGEVFFYKLEHFLQERDLMRTDIAYVYLVALGLGFRGKFHGVDDRNQLHAYKTQLYRFIYHQEPDQKAKLFSQAYSYVNTKGEGRRLHDFRPWFLAFGVVLLSLLFCSYTFWHQATQPLEKILNQIVQTNDLLIRRE